MSHWNSAQQLCQQNMVFINYGNQLINPVLFTRRKWTWKHWGILQSGALPGQLHNRFLQRSFGGKVNVSPASFKKSFLFLLLNHTAKLLTASTSWKSWPLWTCITKKSINIQSFWLFHFLGNSLNLRLSLSPKLYLIVLKNTKQKTKHTALPHLPQQSTGANDCAYNTLKKSWIV